MLWTITRVADHERGLRYRDGRLIAWLEPGRNLLWWPGPGTRDETLDLRWGVTAWTPELAAVVPPGAAVTLEVPWRHVALVTADGRPRTVLEAGRWLLWQLREKVEATVHDTTPLRSTLPEAVWPMVPETVQRAVVVLPYERVVLYVDGEVVEVLGPGRHAVNVGGREVAMVRVDLREQELQIAGQDVMTADKVTLRVNLLVRYRVVDPGLALSAVTNVRDALYGEAQMAARRLVSHQTLDQLLEVRDGVATRMLDEVRTRATGWGLEVGALDVKDVVLPGEMRTILNQVIEAEKRAAAMVVLRREETAATRSLANTAKLLEQNPVLVRLKELEALERMADKVGTITVLAAPDQLLGTLRLPG